MTRTITPAEILPGMTIRATRKRGPWTTIYEGKVRGVYEGRGEEHSSVRFETSVSMACIISLDFTIEVLREPAPPEPQGLWSTAAWHEPGVGEIVAIYTGKDWILLDAGKEVYTTSHWVIPWERVITLSAGAPLTIHDTAHDKEKNQ